MKRWFYKLIIVLLAALILANSAFATQQARKTEQSIGSGFGGSIAQLRLQALPLEVVPPAAPVKTETAAATQQAAQSAPQTNSRPALTAVTQRPAAANAPAAARRQQVPQRAQTAPQVAVATTETVSAERNTAANPYRLGASRDFTLLTRLVVKNTGAEVSRNVSLDVPLITSDSLYFRERGEQFSLQPSEIKTVNGTRVGVFIFGDLAPGEEKILEIRNRVSTALINFSAKYLPSGGNQITTHLDNGEGIESNHPQIISLAKELTEKKATDWEKAEAISRWVSTNIRYDDKAANRNKGALQALQTKSGVCEDYAKLVVALARAANIPARVVYGYTDNGNNWPTNGRFALRGFRHAWVEFHLEGRGWVPAEPTRSSVSTHYFGRLPHNLYIIQNYSNISLRGSHRGGRLSVAWTDSLE